jgi:flagellar hook-length control protein FliK
MSIPAISSLIVAAGGKAALPGSGEILSDKGLPLDFAALLAGQIPISDPTALTAPSGPTVETVAEAIPEKLQLDTELLSSVIPQAGIATDNTTRPSDGKQTFTAPEVEEGAAAILAALSASPKQLPPTPTAGAKQPATELSLEESEKDRKRESEKEGNNEETKAVADSRLTPTDPSLLAQYAIPLAPPAVPNRTPDSVDRGKPVPAGQITRTSNSLTPGKEARPDLPEQSAPLASESPGPTALPAAQATALAAPRITPRSDAANAAILAGDQNAGNSGNTPAFATALAATGTPNAIATPAPRQAEPPMVSTAFNAPNWSHDFGSRVVWLTRNDQQVAQININPPQLGPVQISISLNGDQATATFASPHAEVRQAIQDSMPQLREMFSTAGISLGQANVGSQMPSQNRDSPFQFANGARSSGENAILSPDSLASSAPAGNPIQRGRGLVDLFA